MAKDLTITKKNTFTPYQQAILKAIVEDFNGAVCYYPGMEAEMKAFKRGLIEAAGPPPESEDEDLDWQMDVLDNTIYELKELLVFDDGDPRGKNAHFDLTVNDYGEEVYEAIKSAQ